MGNSGHVIKQRVTILLGLKKFHKAACMQSIDNNVIKLIVDRLLDEEKQNIFKQLNWQTNHLRGSISQQLSMKTKAKSRYFW
jgi:hypothetical protein